MVNLKFQQNKYDTYSLIAHLTLNFPLKCNWSIEDIEKVISMSIDLSCEANILTRFGTKKKLCELGMRIVGIVSVTSPLLCFSLSVLLKRK